MANSNTAILLLVCIYFGCRSLCYSWRCSVYYSQACILFVYVVAAITAAALATVFAPTLDAALAAALAAGFAAAVFAPTLDAALAAALAAGFTAAPAAAKLCRNG